jgi:hypothetical protein
MPATGAAVDHRRSESKTFVLKRLSTVRVGMGLCPPHAEFFEFHSSHEVVMPFRIFLLPVVYGDDATDELNAFIASHRVALNSLALH